VKKGQKGENGGEEKAITLGNSSRGKGEQRVPRPWSNQQFSGGSRNIPTPIHGRFPHSTEMVGGGH